MLVNAREGHGMWSRIYDGTPNPMLHLEERLVAPWIHQIGSRTVADVACGTGRWARHAALRGARVIALDFSAAMLLRASPKLPDGCCVQADATRLPLRAESVDWCICCFAAGYIASPDALIGELMRITRAGGRIALTDLHPQALESGWKRSFRYAGASYEIQHYAHSIERYHEAARRRALLLEDYAQASLGEPERSIFAAAGREEFFPAAGGVPAVFACLWRRV